MTKKDFRTFLSGLETQLAGLTPERQLAFAASCCERAYPNYELFSRKENWGDPTPLRTALDAVWSFILQNSLSETDWQALLSNCKAATPDSDNFNPVTEDASVLIVAAQEAAFMVTLLLEFRRDRDPNYGVRIASFGRDTVDMCVQVLDHLAPADPQLENKIGQHPLLLQELAKQEEDLALLQEIKTSAALTQFWKRALNPQRSNIGLLAE